MIYSSDNISYQAVYRKDTKNQKRALFDVKNELASFTQACHEKSRLSATAWALLHKQFYDIVKYYITTVFPKTRVTTNRQTGIEGILGPVDETNSFLFPEAKEQLRSERTKEIKISAKKIGPLVSIYLSDLIDGNSPEIICSKDYEAFQDYALNFNYHYLDDTNVKYYSAHIETNPDYIQKNPHLKIPYLQIIEFYPSPDDIVPGLVAIKRKTNLTQQENTEILRTEQQQRKAGRK